MLIKAKGKDHWCAGLQDYVSVAGLSQPAAKQVASSLPEATDIHEGDVVVYVSTVRYNRPSVRFVTNVQLAEVVCIAGSDTIDIKIAGTDLIVGTRKRCVRQLPVHEKIDEMMRRRNK